MDEVTGIPRFEVSELSGAQVLVTGAGVSGPGTVRLLHALGARCVATDSRPAALERLAEQAAGAGGPGSDAQPELADAARAAELLAAGAVDLVVTSPGWRPDSELLTTAAERRIPVWGDVELAWRVDAAELLGPRRTWLAVTGTNGKTTTTGMLESICVTAGMAAAACGNIGVPVTEVLLAEPRVDVLACELSSFQLHWAPSCRPDVGVVLNIAEDHIDWHGSMAAYAAAKGRVLDGTIAVAGLDDPVAATLLEGCRAESRIGFRAGEPEIGELGVVDGYLVDRAFSAAARPLLSVEDVSPRGPAGILDALAAAAVALAAGVEPEHVAQGLRAFRVGAHRAAVVEVLDGVTYVDDSKATNPHAARSSLAAGPSMVWIAGGLLKGADVEPLVEEVADRLRGVVLIGRDRRLIADALARHAPSVPVVELKSGDHDEVAGAGTGTAAETTTEPQRTMDRAVAEARALARPGDTVLLAPAAASMDMFTDYGHRGRSFAQAVAGLAGR